MKKPPVKVGRVLFTREQIQERLDVLAGRIQKRYAGEDLTVVAVLKGSLIFTADLVRRLDLPVRMDILEVASYFDNTKPAEQLVLSSYMVDDLRGRNVLVVDDIVDTGATLSRVLGMIGREGPKSLATCVFLDKIGRRNIPVRVDFRGFEIETDEFVVGYGLDYAQRFRNLPHLAVLEKTPKRSSRLPSGRKQLGQKLAAGRPRSRKRPEPSRAPSPGGGRRRK